MRRYGNVIVAPGPETAHDRELFEKYPTLNQNELRYQHTTPPTSLRAPALRRPNLVPLANRMGGTEYDPLLKVMSGDALTYLLAWQDQRKTHEQRLALEPHAGGSGSRSKKKS